MKNVLDIKAELCQTNATAIAANNGTHRKYFRDDKKYEKFYEMLCGLMSITCEPACYYLQSLLVQWLRDNVDDQCAHWFETRWTGQVKGRYLLGSCGVGLVSNNQSLEATWRWDRHACTSGSQVISPKYYVPYPKYYVPYPKYYVPYPKYNVPYPKYYVPYPKYYAYHHILRWACSSTWPTCSRP